MNYRQDKKGASERIKIVEKEFGGRSQIEYAYVICDSPREIEKMLLRDYFKKHLELPPINRNGPI